MLYATLFRHRLRRLWRGGAGGAQWIKRLIVGFFGLYFASSLAVVGYAYPQLLHAWKPDLDPVALVNTMLLSAILGLGVLRFFTQRSSKMDLRPYVSLPLDRGTLVRFAQATSLASLLNLFPFALLLPLWYRTFLLGSVPEGGAVLWLAGAGLWILFTHFANNYLRLLLAHDAQRFIAAAGAVALVLGLDHVLGTRAASRLSTVFFGGLLDGQAALLLIPAALLLFAWVASSRLLRRSLQRAHLRPQLGWQSVPASFSSRRGTTRNLMLLELKLIARNRRPATLVAISAVLIASYVPVLLLGRSAFPLIDAVAGLFVSGILAASYGQLMFAWDSAHFDGMLTRPTPPRTLLRAKLLLLQSACAASFLFALPLFVWLAPDLLLLSTGFLLYNLGITCPFVLFFALWNRKGLAPQRSGFFNYEGLSAQHWIGSLPVFIPPLVLLYVLDASLTLVGISVVGLLGLALFPTWTLFFARLLTRRRHRMAAGFRKPGG